MPTTQSKRKPRTQSEVMDLAEAAAFLRVPEEDLTTLVVAGEVPARQIGTAWRLHRDALAAWLSGGRPSGQSAPKTESRKFAPQHYEVSKDDQEFEEKIALLRQHRAIVKHLHGPPVDDSDFEEQMALMRQYREEGR